MAEVKRVSGKMQVDTEGGVARATYEMAVARKAVGSFTGEIGVFTGDIGVTNAELGNKEAFGNFTCEIGVTKAEPGIKEGAGSCSGTKAKPPSGTREIVLVNKEAAGSFTREIGATKALSFTREICATKAVPANKEAAGSFTGGIGATKAVLLNKQAAGSCTMEKIVVDEAVVRYKDAAGGFTRAVVGNKEAAGGFTRAVVGNKEAAGGFTNAVVGNKEAAGIFTKTVEEIGFTKTASGTGMLTEAAWINYVILSKKNQDAFLQGRKAEPLEKKITKDGFLIIKEKVPDSFVNILKERTPFKKLPPIDKVYSNYLTKCNPKLLEFSEAVAGRRNYCIDLHHDILKQLTEKGCAEVGVDYTGGVKKIFILP